MPPFFYRLRAACRFSIPVMGALLAAPAAFAANGPIAALSEMTIEQLMNIEITSVSRHAERLADAPASVFVISGEDIRRSGVTSVPDALRLAPNLQVTQTKASGYTVTARGFASSSANKLLVLIDGRSVYSPLFSGVFWDVQDVMLEDIERIEIISGPGGTLWGTNAVNGVINIITRSSMDTGGTLLVAGGGNRESGAALRSGGALGEHGSYRVYGKYFDRDHTNTANGTLVDDAWHKGQIGFRTDWQLAQDSLMVQGNAYRGAEGQPLPGVISISNIHLALGAIPISGANLTGRWSHQIDGGASLVLETYYDHTERDVPPTFGEKLDIVDLQFQHTLAPMGIHTLSWGAGYRHSYDRLTNSPYFAFLPANLHQTWSSAFAQDDMVLRQDVRLTLGARIERNDYTGNEFLPNARLAWKVSVDHLVWAAASRTVRSPSRFDRDPVVPGTPPFLLAGGPNVRSELANVYEIGYRGQPASNLSYSITAFHAGYDHLRTQEIAPSRTFFIFANQMEGRTSGVEMWGSWQATSAWQISGGVTGLRERLQLKPGSNDVTAVDGAGRDPAQSWIVRSAFDLPRGLEFNLTVRRVGALTNPAVPAYTAVDARLGWKPLPRLELSIAGQNLNGSHGEFTSVATRAELGRSFFFKVLWSM